MASRMHAADAYLVLVIPQKTQMIVKIRHLAATSGAPIQDLVVPVPPHTPSEKGFAAVADAAANAIIDSWKVRSAVDFSKRSKLLAEMHVNTLEEWAQAIEKLETVSTVTEVSVVAMNFGEARVAISYVGSTDQLNEQLAHSGLTLFNENGQWWLSRSDAEARP